MKSKFILTVGFCFGVGALCAQFQPNALDEKYVPTKNAIFGVKDADKAGNAQATGYTYRHIVKFVPTSLVRSIAAFQYEYLFSEQLSGTAALGLVYNRDKIQAFRSDVFDGNTSANGYNNASFDYLMKNSEYGGGITPMVGLGIRFYYSGYYNSNDYFFEINYKGYKNNMKLLSTSSPGASSSSSTYYYVIGDKNYTVHNNSINVVYGIQLEAGNKIITTHDLYFSIGLNFLKYDGFTMQDYSNNYTGISYTALSKHATVSRLLPVFNMGYAFGIAFGQGKKTKQRP